MYYLLGIRPYEPKTQSSLKQTKKYGNEGASPLLFKHYSITHDCYYGDMVAIAMQRGINISLWEETDNHWQSISEAFRTSVNGESNQGTRSLTACWCERSKFPSYIICEITTPCLWTYEHNNEGSRILKLYSWCD